MAQISCGCTQQRADETCERGRKLFAVVSHTFADLLRGTGATPGDEQRVYTLALLAYRDHLRGWWEGDVKVQRRMEAWMVYARVWGRWLFHFGTKDSAFLKEWLHLRGYQQFVNGGGEQANDQISGYYRKNNSSGAEGNLPQSHPPEGVSTQDGAGEYAGRLGEQKPSSVLPLSSQIDLKTRVAICIALLVARIPHAPTLLERLHIERRAANLLWAQGIQVGPRDEQTLRELIEEAIQQKEGMNEVSRRNTQALQQ